MSKQKLQFPISIKLILITMLLILLTVIPMTKKSLDIFEKTSRRSNEEQNLSQAMQKAEEINTLLRSYIDKARSLGSFMLNEKQFKDEQLMSDKIDAPLEINSQIETQIQAAKKSIESVFQLDRELLAVELYEVKSGAPLFINRETKEEKWKSIGLESTYIDKMRKAEPLPLMKVVQGQFLIFNSTQSPSVVLRKAHDLEKLGILVIGAPLAINNQGQVTSFVITYVELARLQKLFNSKGSRATFVTDESGTLIVHSFSKFTDEKPSFSSHPVVAKSILDSAPKKQMKYIHPTAKENYLAAFVKSPLGLIFVSEVSEKSVLMPVKVVKRQAIYVAGVMLSIMVIIVFLFSTSLTIPIERLVAIAQKVAKGDFEINARAAVRSRDEVGTLASAFDDMVVGLKERDKVKTLFSKFHGSSIAEEMMQGEIGMRGSNKEVTVFFSDVRGFTAFSEGHTPEEVVDMLNEYFAIMVSIINKNHGVVDKFIGDAIMAVWGAPKSTGEDSYWCVKACLEMREALSELNKVRGSRGHVPIMVGMGVHAGPAISGTIGSNERMEYTVIGDTVNQTSRIESSTKAFGTDLLISNEVAEIIGSKFWIEFAGSAEVKGKTEPLKMFKVKGRMIDGQQVEVKTPYSEYHAEKADKVKVVA